MLAQVLNTPQFFEDYSNVLQNVLHYKTLGTVISLKYFTTFNSSNI